MSVLLPKQIDVNKLKYSEVKTMKSGSKQIYVNYGSEKLTIQTPSLYLPYGISPPYSEKDNNEPSEKFIPGSSLDVSFRGIDENPKIKTFCDKLKEIEQKIIDDAFENRQAWFKDDFDGNKLFVKKLFSPIVKVDKDKNTGKELGKYPPTFKAKIAVDYNKNPQIECVDMDNNELDFLEIFKNLKGARSILIVQLTGIWLAGGKYGCSWKVCSGKFQIAQNVKVNFVLDSEEDEEEDEEEIVPDINIKNNKKNVARQVPSEEEEEEETDDKQVETAKVSDEEEDEEEEEEEEEVIQQPPPVKKSVPAPPKKKLTKK